MNLLFEKFIRRFLAKHVGPDAKVEQRRIPWQRVDAAAAAERHLPQLVTDVVLESPHRTLVIDAKYYKAPLSGGRRGGPAGGPVVEPANLNQMFAYVTNFAVTGTTLPVEGLILYAATDELPYLRDDFVLHGKRIRVATLSLASEWQHIHQELLELVA